MAIDGQKFAKLCRTLSEIDLFGAAPAAPPWGATPTEQGFRQAVESARSLLPLNYQQGYAGPVLANVQHVLAEAWAAETVAGAVYDHAPANSASPTPVAHYRVAADTRDGIFNGRQIARRTPGGPGSPRHGGAATASGRHPSRVPRQAGDGETWV